MYIPKEHYIGQGSKDDSISSAMMTPEGKDSSAIKRKETIHRNLGVGCSYAGSPVRTIDDIYVRVEKNELRHGFKITGSNQYYGTCTVDDPRGFRYDISLDNLVGVLKTATVENGAIKEKCIWGRNGREDILLVEGSPQYASAVKETGRVDKKASIKDLKAGDEVVFKNGTKGVYFGLMTAVMKPRTSNMFYARGAGTNISLDWTERRRGHVFGMKVGDEVRRVALMTSPKISIISDSPQQVYTKQEMEDHVNDLILSGMIVDPHSYRNSRQVAFLSSKVNVSDSDFDIELTEIDKKNCIHKEWNTIVADGSEKDLTIRQDDSLIIKDKDNNYHIASPSYAYKMKGSTRDHGIIRHSLTIEDFNVDVERKIVSYTPIDSGTYRYALRYTDIPVTDDLKYYRIGLKYGTRKFKG